MQVSVKQYVQHHKFWTFAKLVEKFESHAKMDALSQMPSLLGQKLGVISKSPQAEKKTVGKMNVDETRKLYFGNLTKF